MIVVADASPLNYLVQVHLTELLENLYGRVLIPTAVLVELQAEKTPATVAEWARNLPSWISVRSAQALPATESDELGLGEREAIALALEEKAGLLLIDDKLGRAEAERRGSRPQVS